MISHRPLCPESLLVFSEPCGWEILLQAGTVQTCPRLGSAPTGKKKLKRPKAAGEGESSKTDEAHYNHKCSKPTQNYLIKICRTLVHVSGYVVKPFLCCVCVFVQSYNQVHMQQCKCGCAELESSVYALCVEEMDSMSLCTENVD